MNVIFKQRVPVLKAVILTQLTASITLAGTLVAQADSVDLDTVANTYPAQQTKSATQILVDELRGNQIQSAAEQPLQQASASPVPIPGTTATSSTALMQSSVVPPTAQSNTPNSVAQILVDPGQPTRGGSSYIGVAGNIGLSDSGSTALGDGSFVIISKIGLTSSLSARPSVVLGDNAVILVPVTYDFSFQPVEAFADPLPIAPYVGGGFAISTGDDSTFGAVLTGGVDVPITSQFTATAALNVAFVDSTDVGILIGVGYNFGGFGL